MSPLLASLPFLNIPLAYIGPGAGFALGGSFLFAFAGILLAVVAVLAWPVRVLLRSLRGRGKRRKGAAGRVVVLGLDGFDPVICKKMMDSGDLPHLSALKKEGGYRPLLTTYPAMSPVGWSTFATGVDPSGHNIFDFLSRDLVTHLPVLSSTRLHQRPARSLGPIALPGGGPRFELLRRSKPFWKTCAETGLASTILRVPITFPPEKFYGIQLSGMCAPDLRGTQGTFSYFASEPEENGDSTGGEYYHVKMENNIVRSELVGPQNAAGKNNDPLKCGFEIAVSDSRKATLKINGKQYEITKGKYSDWIKVEFKSSPFVKISGICKFLLISTDPGFKLYVTPINIDPEKPAMPISYPAVYSTYLSKKQGYYATLGLAEDSWALNQKLITDDDFLQQCLDADQEREVMFFDSLNNIKHGLCLCVFDGTDRIQHAFWRQMDENHPAHNGKFTASKTSAIEEIYKHADKFLEKIMKQYNEKDTLIMIISDHGFNGFRYGVDLNRWLEENGYLKLKEEGRNKKNLSGVDWSKTRAFAMGLSGIFLNIKGRESKGIVDSKTEASALREEIAGKLRQLNDPIRNQQAVKQVYNAQKIYSGPYKNNAPDLIVGYQVGYRASWETAVGQVTEQIFHDNIKAWSGDHCIDHSLVPGVLFCNHKINDERPRLMDIGPTVLNMFGVEVPAHMDGRQLDVVDG